MMKKAEAIVMCLCALFGGLYMNPVPTHAATAAYEFHTYGFNWYEGGITWYVDGNPVYTAPCTDIFPTHPGKIMMNVWPGIGVDDWLNPYNGKTPLHAYYDWISWDSNSSY